MNRLKTSLVLFPIGVVIVVGIYVYSLWAAEKQRTAEIPFEAADRMMRDLRLFHEKQGRFPDDLKELEGVVWDKKQERNYPIKHRALTHRNYFYLYTRTASHHFTLWSIPVGNLREESPTVFLSVSTDGCRRWKGPALDSYLVRKLDISPSPSQLGVLGLTEQSGCDPPKAKRDSP